MKRMWRLVTTTTVVILLLDNITKVISATEGKTIFVTPNSKIPCPSEQCFTISELNDNTIVTDTTIYFLPGRHIVGNSNKSITPIRIRNIDHIQVIGDYNISSQYFVNTTIECTQPFGFEFNTIVILTISSLKFVNCSFSKAVTDNRGNILGYLKGSIYIRRATYVSMVSVTVTNGTDLGIHIVTAHQVNMKNINLSHIRISKLNGWVLNLDNINTAFVRDIVCVKSSKCFAAVKSKVIAFLGNATFDRCSGTVISSFFSNITIGDNSKVVITNVFNDFYESEENSEDSIVTTRGTRMFFGRNSSVRIENNTALYGCGGISVAIESELLFLNNSTLIFLRNKGRNGGALALYDSSQLRFSIQIINIQFIENKARSKGGAIFVDDTSYITYSFRDIVMPVLLCNTHAPLLMHFINNTAEVAGDALYGGLVDWPHHITAGFSCSQCSSRVPFPCNENWFEIATASSDLSTITSNPIRVCICSNSIPNCTITNYETWLYPGQTFELEAVAVGQTFGTVPSIVQADLTTNRNEGTLGRGQTTQSVGRYCTPLQYTVMSSNKQETIHLNPQTGLITPFLTKLTEPRTLILSVRPEFELLYSRFFITFHLKDCPLGYIFNDLGKKCTCHPTLVNHGITCNTNDYSIQRPPTKWINATFTHTSNVTVFGILVHNNCPFDYCYNNGSQNINLDHPEQQCDLNRSGILCGTCQNNFSHVFGTSRCKKCSTLMVLLMVPTVIVAGIVLVAFLMVLDLTVSIGTINGLIFYANIVQANQAIFFPTAEKNNPFLSLFIAWINLDLGIETCFYDGLDAYTKTWLQFIFPLYIWLLVTIIIVSCHYSSTVSRWTGSNAVQVLATLFLLSYVKLLRLIITVFLSTTIVYPDGYIKTVWLYDGNVDYLKGKHILLFIAALFTLFIIAIPYTATLFTIQWLQRHRSCNRILFWVRKFKPIFDAYTGPYKNNHRYWTGKLLLVRVTLLLIFTLNLTGDPSVNLLAIAVVVNCLSLYFLLIGGPYVSKMVNLIEISFYFNVCILSTATVYKLKIESNSTAFATTSTSISFVIFMFIVFCHALQRITQTRRGAKVKRYFEDRAIVLVNRSKPALNSITGQGDTTNTRPVISHSSIELKEPLMADIQRNVVN